jgi:hypothetical protein
MTPLLTTAAGANQRGGGVTLPGVSAKIRLAWRQQRATAAYRKWRRSVWPAAAMAKSVTKLKISGQRDESGGMREISKKAAASGS